MNRDAQIILIALLLVIGFSVGVIVSPNVLPLFMSTPEPELRGHDYRYYVNGTTMQPTLDVGMIVYVDVVTNMNQIQIDDIIAFRSPYNEEDILVHRVIERIETTEGIIFRTKGDANPVRDPWQLQEEYVIGLVVEYE
jgi:signal peptidase